MFKYIKLNFFVILVLFAMLFLSQPAINYVFYILFVFCINLGVKFKSLLNPYFIFSLSLLSLLSYNPALSDYLIDISLEVYFLIFCGMFSFLLGMIVVDKTKKIQKAKLKINTKVSLKRMFLVVLFLGLIPHIIGFVKVGIPILDQVNLAESRDNYLPSGLSYFIFFLPLTIIIAFLSKNKKLINLSIVLNAVVSILRVSKFDILVFMIFLLFAYLKYGEKKNSSIRKISLFSSVLFSIPFIFDWFYNLRLKRGSTADDFGLSTNLIPEFLSLPYLYFTTAWSNLTQTILSLPDFNFGAYTFFPFYSALQFDNLIPKVSSKVIYQHPFNTFSFLTDFYMDFGTLGIVIIPFLLGFLLFYSYHKSIENSNPIRDGQFVILAIPSLMLFFSNHFTSVGYPFIVFILFGIIGKFFSMKVK